MPDLVRVRVAFCALRRVVGDFTKHRTSRQIERVDQEHGHACRQGSRSPCGGSCGRGHRTRARPNYLRILNALGSGTPDVVRKKPA